MKVRLLFFLVACLCAIGAGANDRSSEQDSIIAIANTVAKSGNYIENLNSSTPAKCPLGIKNSSCKYAIIIDKIEITEQGGFIDASASIEFPGYTSTPICFRAKRIHFTSDGGIGSSMRLELVSEQTISLIGGARMVIPNDGKTYVEFDCNGFKQMGLSADLILILI